MTNVDKRLSFLSGNAIAAFFGKEMSSFLKFSRLTNIRIVSIIQPFFMTQELERISGFIRDISIFQSFESAECNDAQLLIVGYTKILSKARGSDYLRIALLFALENHLNVFCFDNIYVDEYRDIRDKMDEKGILYYSPLVVPAKPLDKLHPDLQHSSTDQRGSMILGTSSNQGKFTLMLRLISKIREKGLNVGTIGTEHQSAFFNIDCVFPYGVSASVLMPMSKYPCYLALERDKLYKRGVSHILSCSQSGILPYSLKDIYNKSFTLSTISFYLSLRPGNVILVVNSKIDSMEYIQETISFIRHIGGAHVVCLAFSDMERSWENESITYRRLETSDVAGIKQSYRKEFGLEAINIMDDADIERAIEMITDGGIAI